jgi:hypothetical protein
MGFLRRVRGEMALQPLAPQDGAEPLNNTDEPLNAGSLTLPQSSSAASAQTAISSERGLFFFSIPFRMALVTFSRCSGSRHFRFWASLVLLRLSEVTDLRDRTFLPGSAWRIFRRASSESLQTPARRPAQTPTPPCSKSS